jgi:hypothetical protein
MKKINLRYSFLQILYLIIFSILFSFIIYTPTLIKGSVNLSSKLILEEDTVEGFLLLILFIMGILTFNLFRREVDKQKELINKINDEKRKVEVRLTDSEQYIGITNVQIQEIKYIFNSLDKFPRTKDDLNKIFHFYGERVIGITNSEWVLFRIIDRYNQKTICDHFVPRKGFSNGYPHVSNKMILERQSILPFSYIISNTINLNILVFCVIPVEKVNNDQHVFIQAILNEITKLYVILNYSSYKKVNQIFIEDNTTGK